MVKKKKPFCVHFYFTVLSLRFSPWCPPSVPSSRSSHGASVSRGNGPRTWPPPAQACLSDVFPPAHTVSLLLQRLVREGGIVSTPPELPAASWLSAREIRLLNDLEES